MTSVIVEKCQTKGEEDFVSHVFLCGGNSGPVNEGGYNYRGAQKSIAPFPCSGVYRSTPYDGDVLCCNFTVLGRVVN